MENAASPEWWSTQSVTETVGAMPLGKAPGASIYKIAPFHLNAIFVDKEYVRVEVAFLRREIAALRRIHERLGPLFEQGGNRVGVVAHDFNVVARERAGAVDRAPNPFEKRSSSSMSPPITTGSPQSLAAENTSVCRLRRL